MRYRYGYGSNRRQRRRKVRAAGLSSVIVLGTLVSFVYTGRVMGVSVAKKEPKVVAPANKSMAAPKGEAAKNKPKTVSAPPSVPAPVGCNSVSGSRTGLAQSSVSQLRKLAEYEKVCGGQVGDRVSFFAPTPTTEAEAREIAVYVADNLKAFARAGVMPLVFMEPTRVGGGLVDINAYLQGGYDTALDSYFAAIKTAGISDAQMGLWVPLPEWNIPLWGSVDPSVFTNLVTRTVGQQKKHFPASKAGILLESKTYPTAASWEGGAYVSLLPYVQHMPAGLLDSFGMQGFPWGPDSNGYGTLLDPKTYLPAGLAIEAARRLGVPEVWFNTGSFRVFAKDPAHTLFLSPEQRQAILAGVITQAGVVKQAGYQTAIHLFAKDKSVQAEKIDWSYWSRSDLENSPTAPAFRTFVGNSRTAGVAVWLYDDDTQ